MASVAEVKAAVDAALQQVTEGQAAIQAAREKLGEAQQSLAAVLSAGLPGLPGPVEVTLVVEGRARDVPESGNGVRVARATGSGDDKITELVRAAGRERHTVVITADRGLRDRVTPLGAEVRGPSSVPRR